MVLRHSRKREKKVRRFYVNVRQQKPNGNTDMQTVWFMSVNARIYVK